MHGDWNLRNFVFREDDYLEYARKRPLTENFVKSIFTAHVVLFIGFSFDDRNLKQILDWVKSSLGNEFQPAYLLSVDGKNEQEKNYLKNRGVQLISWNVPELHQILKKTGQKPAKMSSQIGAKTADFLNFLNGERFAKYERLRRAKNQSIVDQLYDALHVFDAFNALPPHRFERLFPFSPHRLSESKIVHPEKVKPTPSKTLIWVFSRYNFRSIEIRSSRRKKK